MNSFHYSKSFDFDINYFSRQVFIGNLCNISNEVLRTYCEKYGSLTELSLNRDKENNVNYLLFLLYNINLFF